MTNEDVDAVLERTPVGAVLLPILKGFTTICQVDAFVYQQVAAALFRAYEFGMKDAIGDFSMSKGNPREPRS